MELSFHVDLGIAYHCIRTELKPIDPPKKKVGLHIGLFITEGRLFGNRPWWHFYIGYYWFRRNHRKILRIYHERRNQC